MAANNDDKSLSNFCAIALSFSCIDVNWYSIILIFLISSKYVSCINFLLYIIQTSVIPVGDNRLALCFESVQVVHHLAAEEGAAIFKCRLVDDYFRTFGFHPLHHALDRGLAEVIAVRFHRQAVNTDDTFLFF